MGTKSLLERVRDLVARAEAGTLEMSELAAHAGDLAELRKRLDRLVALGLEGAAELAPGVAALMERLVPQAVAA